MKLTSSIDIMNKSDKKVLNAKRVCGGKFICEALGARGAFNKILNCTIVNMFVTHTKQL